MSKQRTFIEQFVKGNNIAHVVANQIKSWVMSGTKTLAVDTEDGKLITL